MRLGLLHHFRVRNRKGLKCYIFLQISKTAKSKRRRRSAVSKEASLYNVIFHEDSGFYVQRKTPSETLFNLNGILPILFLHP